MGADGVLDAVRASQSVRTELQAIDVYHSGQLGDVYAGSSTACASQRGRLRFRELEPNAERVRRALSAVAVTERPKMPRHGPGRAVGAPSSSID